MKRLIYLLAAVAFTACGSATSLSVMTFNMRYDNPEDGQNNWRFRRERIAGVIKAQEVDVLGKIGRSTRLNSSHPLSSRMPSSA